MNKKELSLFYILGIAIGSFYFTVNPLLKLVSPGLAPLQQISWLILYQISFLFTGLGSFYGRKSRFTWLAPLMLFGLIHAFFPFQTNWFRTVFEMGLIAFVYFQFGKLIKDYFINLFHITSTAWVIHLMGIGTGLLLSFYSNLNFGPFFNLFLMSLMLVPFSKKLNKVISPLMFLLLFLGTFLYGDKVSTMGTPLQHKVENVVEAYAEREGKIDAQIGNGVLLHSKWTIDGKISIYKFEPFPYQFVFLNQKLLYDVPEKPKWEIDEKGHRPFLYQYLVDQKAKTLVIGIGSGRGFSGVKGLDSNFTAIDVLKGPLDFYHDSALSPTKTWLHQVHMETGNGRWYFQQQKPKWDAVVIESSIYNPYNPLNQFFSVQSLLSAQALNQMLKVLKTDGFFIYEVNNSRKNKARRKSYHFLERFLSDKGHLEEIKTRTDNRDTKILIFSRNQQKLEEFKNFLLSKLDSKTYKPTPLKIKSPEFSLSDTKPFFIWYNLKEEQHRNALMVLILSLLLTLAAGLYGRFKSHNKNISTQGFLVGLTNSSFSVFGLFYPWYHFHSLHNQLLLVLILPLFGSLLYFFFEQNTLRICVTLVFLSCALMGHAPLVALILVLVFQGGFYPYLIKRISESEFGNIQLSDSIGMFAGYLLSILVMLELGLHFLLGGIFIVLALLAVNDRR